MRRRQRTAVATCRLARCHSLSLTLAHPFSHLPPTHHPPHHKQACSRTTWCPRSRSACRAGTAPCRCKSARRSAFLATSPLVTSSLTRVCWRCAAGCLVAHRSWEVGGGVAALRPLAPPPNRHLPRPASSLPPAGDVSGCKAYMVQQGDTLIMIASVFGIYTKVGAGAVGVSGAGSAAHAAGRPALKPPAALACLPNSHPPLPAPPPLSPAGAGRPEPRGRHRRAAARHLPAPAGERAALRRRLSSLARVCLPACPVRTHTRC